MFTLATHTSRHHNQDQCNRWRNCNIAHANDYSLKMKRKKNKQEIYVHVPQCLSGQIRNTRARAEKKSDKFCWIINILRRFCFYISRLFGVWVDAWFFGRLDVWVYAWSLCIILHDLDWVITFNVWAAVFMRYYNEIDARARTSRMKWREKNNTKRRAAYTVSWARSNSREYWVGCLNVAAHWR